MKNKTSKFQLALVASAFAIVGVAAVAQELKEIVIETPRVERAKEHSTVGAVVNQVLRRTLVGTVSVNSPSSERSPAHLAFDPEEGFPSVKCSQSFTSEDVYLVNGLRGRT